jgi:antitoxin ParD1/3/4
MADIERITIALPEPMAASVRVAVEAGEYASTSEVLRDALRLWEARRELRARDVEELRRRWEAGKASGLAGEIKISDLIADEKTKKARRRWSALSILAGLEDELRAIWRYIAEDNDNEPAADRILLAISEKIELLRNHPPAWPTPFRHCPRRPAADRGAFLLLYETHPDTDEGPVEAVEIVSIVDGRRDLTELF